MAGLVAATNIAIRGDTHEPWDKDLAKDITQANDEPNPMVDQPPADASVGAASPAASVDFTRSIAEKAIDMLSSQKYLWGYYR